MGDLLPCPFCGGKPYMANVDMAGCSYVVCTDCRMQSDDGSQERVHAAWNKRVPTNENEAKLMAEIQRLRAALAAIELLGGSAETYDPAVSKICRDALEG